MKPDDIDLTQARAPSDEKFRCMALFANLTEQEKALVLSFAQDLLNSDEGDAEPH